MRRPPRRSLVAALAVGLTLAVLGAGFAISLTRDPNHLPSVLVGRQAPDFTLATLHGDDSVHLADLRGQVVVVNYFASWCVECQQEAPVLQGAWQEYRHQGVALLGIAFQDQPAQAARWAAQRNLDWPLLDDPGSRTALRYGVTGLPETFVIDRQGMVVDKHVGAFDPDGLRRVLAQVSR